MAATWIVSRDLAQVCEAMDGYRAECWHWVPFSETLAVECGRVWYEVRGEHLESLKPLSLLQMATFEAFDESPVPDVPVRIVKGAREALWRCLANGRIVASGINVERQVVDIPSHQWPYLQLAGSLDGPERLRTDPASRTSYADVKLQPAAILDIWPCEATVERGSPNRNAEVAVSASRKTRRAHQSDAVQKAIIKLFGGRYSFPMTSLMTKSMARSSRSYGGKTQKRTSVGRQSRGFSRTGDVHQISSRTFMKRFEAHAS